MTSRQTEQFLDKLDDFAAGLDPTEQAMLAYLVRDDDGDDVAGFNFFEGWPCKVADLAPVKVASLFHGPSGTGKTRMKSTSHPTRVNRQ